MLKGDDLLNKLNFYFNRKPVKYGLPFLLIVLGGSFGLKEFTQLRYQFSKNQTLTPEEAKQYGIDMKKSEDITLEGEYEKIKQLDLDNWEQKRGPRPWE